MPKLPNSYLCYDTPPLGKMAILAQNAWRPGYPLTQTMPRVSDALPPRGAIVCSDPLIRSFADVKLLEEKGETSACVSIGDLNGDGLMDIVLAKGRHWPLHNRVLVNDGKGGFLASNLGAAPDRTYSAALADVDLDGDLDVVVSNDAPDR